MLGALLKKRPLPGLCAIDFTSEGIIISRLVHSPDKPILEFCNFYPHEIKSSIQQLKKLVSQHKLNQCVWTTLLSRDDYQLLVTEAPSVPKDELRSALRWRIKDLIDTPVSEITLDAFDVPAPRGAGQSNSVYVVVAKNDALNSHSANLLNANINLQIIDIMEMAQRNVANLLPENDNGVALLSVQANSSLITLSKAGELYLSRPMNLGIEQAVQTLPKTNTPEQDDDGLIEITLPDLDLDIGNSAAYDQIALELQRSLDYYESNFRQAPIRKLFLAPTLKELPDFPEYIKDNLNMDVELIDLNNLLECDQTIPLATQASGFFSIGAALHRIDDEPGN